RVVEHRPDVRAAEAQMHAASAQIGVALANRLPQFTITAAGGGTSTSLTQMFANSNPFWVVAGNLSQSIFDGGTLLHRQGAAEAALGASPPPYPGPLLRSFPNRPAPPHA